MGRARSIKVRVGLKSKKEKKEEIGLELDRGSCVKS